MFVTFVMLVTFTRFPPRAYQGKKRSPGPHGNQPTLPKPPPKPNPIPPPQPPPPKPKKETYAGAQIG
jgi:hypothetical protein